jgi:hypothetical protein
MLQFVRYYAVPLKVEIALRDLRQENTIHGAEASRGKQVGELGTTTMTLGTMTMMMTVGALNFKHSRSHVNTSINETSILVSALSYMF